MDTTNLITGKNKIKIDVHGFSVNCILNYQPESEELILCVHGLGCDGNTYEALFNYPEFQKYNILIPDLIGFGESSKPEDFSYELEEQTSVINYLLEQFSFKNIHLVAHSLGGAVVLLLPCYMLDKVESFCNLEGNLTEKDCAVFSKKIISQPYEDFSKSGFDEIKSKISGSRLLVLNKTTPRAMYYTSKSLVKWSDSNYLLKEFKKIKARKAYFFGEENMGCEVLSQLNGIERVMIAHSGHEMMCDNPDEFYNRVYDFIVDEL